MPVDPNAVRRLFVPITWRQAEVLRSLADQEDRDPRRQAARLIIEGLERRGLLNQSAEGAAITVAP